MDNNSPLHFLKNTLANLDGFIKAVESGEGMNLTEEQKKEFKEKFEREGGPKMLQDLNEKRQQLGKFKL